MKKPSLSILIPNFNHAHYLNECLTSVLKEAPENSEIVIIDDASTDHSVDVIRSLSLADNRIKLFINQTNKGVNATLNLGLEKISGEFYFGLAADDKVLPGFFKAMLAVLAKHPQLGLCCSDYAYFHNTHPETIYVNPLLKTNGPVHVFPPETTMGLFRTTHFWVPGHTSMIRTELARRYGGYHEKTSHSSDFYLYHKIALLHPIGYIVGGLSAMRISPKSFSAQCLANRKIRAEAALQFLELVLKDEARKLFRRSTILSPILRSCLRKAIFQPKYWPFFFPIIQKKLSKIVSLNLHNTFDKKNIE